MNNPEKTKEKQGTLRIGIDTGGTFTDLLLLDDQGLHVHKLRSTPDDPSRAILEGILALTSKAAEITHGSTVATNALLERKGARVALITTAGFEDILLIGRQTRAKLYDFQVQAPRPLIESGLIVGVRERIAATGEVLEPLTEAEMQRTLAAIDALKPHSIALCLLHSYANPAHEQALAEALTSAGYLVSTSHQILPEYREFERFATTAVNAYVTPKMSTYLTRLQAGLAPTGTLRIMQSNGGSISAAKACQAAVQTILSGPAAGVVGAQALASLAGHTRIITFDMGGTSTDVSLIDGTIGTTTDSIVGDFPVRLPVLDIHTVGAGGGSIAWIDTGGSLRIGPRSAGADPGPACYGIGSELTVTDANLLLGRLDPSCFLGGRMALDLPRTRALAKAFAKRLNLSERSLAEGMVRIANSNMERAIRRVSVQRGHDPRDFALVAFGGAGGLHACDLADALDIRNVLIPRHSGVLSALGMLLADVVKDYSASILKPTASLTEAFLHSALEPLQASAAADLQAEGFSAADILLTPTLDLRYRGQAYELSIPFSAGEPIAAVEQAFHLAHQRLYGYANPKRATEVIQLRLKATGRTEKPLLTPQSERSHLAEPESVPTKPPVPATIRTTLFHRRPHQTPLYHRNQLTAGPLTHGPAILLTGESTTIIPPTWHWQIHPSGTLIASKNN